jgi:pyruvate dehydrogenase E1 component alpha subunit
MPDAMMNEPDRAQSRAMLDRMLLIRAYEEKAAAMQAAGQAAGTCTSAGQEASAVGVVWALDRRDSMLTNHRSAGHLLARGADPARMFAEVLGKATGYCKGKSGSLHISAKELGVVLTSTIVGAELSLASGVALALAMRKTGSIAACFFGDGAACEGSFHESLNLAAVWNLPILYVCENNQWQAFVHRRETMPVERVSEWAAAHGIPAETVDGNDAAAMHRAARAAVKRVRATSKPCFLETYTYRLRGHYEPDDQSYVEPAELTAWRARDPIILLARTLELRDAELAHARQRATDTIEQAWFAAVAAPYPDLSQLTTDVYA